MHNLPERMPYADTLRLIAEAQAGSVAARNAVIVGNMRLVATVATAAARAAGRPDLVDDLIMAGSMGVAAGDGLLHAVMNYDPSRGARFGTYANPYIREAVNKQLASLGRELGTYKSLEKRSVLRNKAKRLTTTLGRQATPEEVHASLTDKARRDVSVGAVELAMQPTGRETRQELGAGSENEVIESIDEAHQLAEVRQAADYLLSDAQRQLLTRRYGGERLRGIEGRGADAAEAELRAWFAAG